MTARLTDETLATLERAYRTVVINAERVLPGSDDRVLALVAEIRANRAAQLTAEEWDGFRRAIECYTGSGDRPETAAAKRAFSKLWTSRADGSP